MIQSRLGEDQTYLPTAVETYSQMSTEALVREIRSVGGKVGTTAVFVPEDVDEALREEVDRRKEEIFLWAKEQAEIRESSRRFTPIGAKVYDVTGAELGRLWGITANAVMVVVQGSIRRYDPRQIGKVEG